MLGLFPLAVALCESILEVFMPLTVVLAVGLDSSLPRDQTSVWQSAGYLVTFAAAIREAISLFRDGDFDLVLLGKSIPADSKERLTFLIRASGSRIPIVCIGDTSPGVDTFVDATISDEPIRLLDAIGEFMTKRVKTPVAGRAVSGISTREAAAPRLEVR
jgi:hypothetical protein